MKITTFTKLILLISITATLFSCAKDRSPELLVIVTQADGTPAEGAIIRTWPGQFVNSPDPAVDQTKIANAGGSVLFQFEHSIVVDIDVIYTKTTIVNGMPTRKEFTAHKVVQLEVLRQRSKENLTTQNMIVL